MIDIVVPSDSNIKKKEYEKLEKYQGLKEELERMWKVKAKVVPVVIGALGAVSRKLEEWNNIRTLCPEECSARNSKDTEPSNSQASGRGREVEEDTHTTQRVRTPTCLAVPKTVDITLGLTVISFCHFVIW